MPFVVLALWAACFPGVIQAAEPSLAAAPPIRHEYDLRVLTAKPGKLPDLHAWFRAHQDDVLAKHGVTSIGFFVPAGGDSADTLLCLYRYPSRSAASDAWAALMADPASQPLDASADGPEVLVAKESSIELTPTDYSPALAATESAAPRVFELRTYACPSPRHLALLHERFRDHTMGLFKKHGMENVVYWNPGGIDGSERKLVYLLAHRSEAAAKESFGNFRKDPAWLAAKEASEKKAGGSLTEKERGVISEFLVATEYSPLR